MSAPVIVEKDGARLAVFTGYAAVHEFNLDTGHLPPFARDRRMLEEAYASTDNLRRQWSIVPAKLTLRIG